MKLTGFLGVMIRVLILESMALLFRPAVGQAQELSVPRRYAALYQELSSALAAFSDRLGNQIPVNKQPPIYAAELLTANCNRGPELLKPATRLAMIVELDRLSAMGVKGVAVDVHFPLLYLPFHRDAEEYRHYLDFFKTVAAEARKRNLALIMGTQAIFSKEGYSPLPVGEFYRKLNSFDEYATGRAAVAKTIVEELSPDFLSIQNEPDTEQAQTGMPAADTANSEMLLRRIIAAVRSSSRSGSVKLGAGFGTWQKDYRTFAAKLSVLPGLDYIDLHVYPVVGPFTARLFEIAEVAKRHHKPLAFSEIWLYKAGLRELRRGGVAASREFFSRDAYSFWKPLDREFLRLMARYSEAEGALFVSPFWSKYFYSYADYSAVNSLLPYKLQERQTNRGVWAAMTGGRLSETGKEYEAIIAGAAQENRL